MILRTDTPHTRYSYSILILDTVIPVLSESFAILFSGEFPKKPSPQIVLLILIVLLLVILILIVIVMYYNFNIDVDCVRGSSDHEQGPVSADASGV